MTRRQQPRKRCALTTPRGTNVAAPRSRNASSQRRAEQLLRERDWEQAQVERLTADLQAVDSLVIQLAADVYRLEQDASTELGSAGQAAANAARRSELRARLDDLRRQRRRPGR